MGVLMCMSFFKSKLAEFQVEQLRPPRLLTGDDLIEAGYAPGPAFKKVIELTETAQLEGEIETREQALALARSVLSEDDQTSMKQDDIIWRFGSAVCVKGWSLKATRRTEPDGSS